MEKWKTHFFQIPRHFFQKVSHIASLETLWRMWKLSTPFFHCGDVERLWSGKGKILENFVETRPTSFGRFHILWNPVFLKKWKAFFAMSKTLEKS